METKKKYFAFISYKSEDKEWAIWLQHELEHYHLPSTLNGRTDLPHELRPVFRDIDELSAGNLPEQIYLALVNSANLIVVCSPLSAQSPWVNQEVETFIAMGKTGRIFPFIVEGQPLADNTIEECFPQALRELPEEEERLGGDVNKNGRDAAFVKVVAGMLDLGFDTLWNRYEKEKAEEERKQREQKDAMLSLQTRFVMEKAYAEMNSFPYDKQKAARIMLEVLPQDINRPNRPFVPEVEHMFREATLIEDSLFLLPVEKIDKRCFNDKWCIATDQQAPISIEESPRLPKTIRVFNINTLLESRPIDCPDGVSSICICQHWRIIAAISGKTILVADVCNGCIDTIPLSFYPRILAVSPNGTFFAVSNDENEIHLFSRHNLKEHRVFALHKKEVVSIVFNDNEKTVISTSFDGLMMAWSSETTLPVWQHRFNGITRANCTRLARKGTVAIITYDKNHNVSKLNLYNPVSDKEIHAVELEGFNCVPMYNSISLDEKKIIVLTPSNDMYVYYVDTGIVALQCSGCKNASFNMTSDSIYVTKSNDIVNYKFPPMEKLINLSRERYKDNPLSPEERRRYYIE